MVRSIVCQIWQLAIVVRNRLFLSEKTVNDRTQREVLWSKSCREILQSIESNNSIRMDNQANSIGKTRRSD